MTRIHEQLRARVEIGGDARRCNGANLCGRRISRHGGCQRMTTYGKNSGKPQPTSPLPAVRPNISAAEGGCKRVTTYGKCSGKSRLTFVVARWKDARLSRRGGL